VNLVKEPKLAQLGGGGIVLISNYSQRGLPFVRRKQQYFTTIVVTALC